MPVCRYAHGYVRFPAFTKEVDIFSLYVCLYVCMDVGKKVCTFLCVHVCTYQNRSRKITYLGVPLYAQSQVHLIIPLVCSNGTAIIACAFLNLRLILK
jgi:hypothetical protein